MQGRLNKQRHTHVMEYYAAVAKKVLTWKDLQDMVSHDRKQGADSVDPVLLICV